MHCERIQDLLLDLHAGALPDGEAGAVRDHLRSCPACQREWSTLQETLLKLDRLPAPEPSPRLAASFYAMLESHERGTPSQSPFVSMRSRLDRFFAALLPTRPALQAALAVAALAAGVYGGARFLRAPEAAPAVAETHPDAATQAEIADLRSQVNSLRDAMNASIERVQAPGADRLRAVLAVVDKPGTDEGGLAGLLGTLAFDPNTNVRLAALEALYAHADREVVRAGVLATLPREPSPLVQVAMIDFLTATRDANAAPTFEAMSNDDRIDQAVRTAARRALAQL